MSNRFRFSIKDCARCGENHMNEQLEAIPFDKKPTLDDDEDIPTHWAECPKSGDPILVYTGGTDAR